MAKDSSARVRPFAPEEWTVLREVRLAALRDSPAAFLSTYEDTKDRPEPSWRAWPDRGVALGVWLDGQPVGMVGVATMAETPRDADLFAMWVAPAARGTGAADALVRGAIDWAVREACTTVKLEVAPGNERAEKLYERHQFVRTDEPTMVKCGQVMRRHLS